MALLAATSSTTLGRFRALLPVALVGAAVALMGLRGIRDPLALLVLGAGGLWLIALTLERAPVALFWLVPASMCAFVYLPLMHYEALVALLGLLMLLGALREVPRPRIVLQPVELRYLVFLATSLPGIPAALSLYRYGGALKLYVVGLVGFLVARHASRRFGRATMLWGPTVLVGITVATLALRSVTSGIPVFRSALLRSYLSLLPWGSSNYVAAVMVLCLPGLVLLFQELGGRPRARLLTLGIIVASVLILFVTVSRGGFAMSVLYLGMMGFWGRRVPWRLLAGVAIGLGLMALSPLGQAMVGRFTNAQSADSIFSRMMIWDAGLHRGMIHLPFGVGLGQGWLQRDALQGIDPHDFPLTLFGELGPLGLLAWFWMIPALWSAASRLGRDPASRPAAMAMRATLVLGILNSLFEPTLTGNLYHLLFWWLLGIYHGAGAPADVPVKSRVPGAAGAADQPSREVRLSSVSSVMTAAASAAPPAQ